MRESRAVVQDRTGRSEAAAIANAAVAARRLTSSEISETGFRASSLTLSILFPLCAGVTFRGVAGSVAHLADFTLCFWTA